MYMYLSTTIRFTPDGSNTVHIYTQTIHITTQITTNLEECRPCPVFASFTQASALQLRKKSMGKPQSGLVYRGRGGMCLFILNLSMRWRQVGCYTVPCLSQARTGAHTSTMVATWKHIKVDLCVYNRVGHCIFYLVQLCNSAWHSTCFGLYTYTARAKSTPSPCLSTL
jgi:hypothetical protein